MKIKYKKSLSDIENKKYDIEIIIGYKLSEEIL
ncbi:MAG: hypothetical protein K0S47_4470 [Herbinix sp.]|jgi:hypothetical protein|nr:hypothetical protein [Herbinix sp.]